MSRRQLVQSPISNVRHSSYDGVDGVHIFDCTNYTMNASNGGEFFFMHRLKYIYEVIMKVKCKHCAGGTR